MAGSDQCRVATRCRLLNKGFRSLQREESDAPYHENSADQTPVVASGWTAFVVTSRERQREQISWNRFFQQRFRLRID